MACTNNAVESFNVALTAEIEQLSIKYPYGDHSARGGDAMTESEFETTMQTSTVPEQGTADPMPHGPAPSGYSATPGSCCRTDPGCSASSSSAFQAWAVVGLMARSSAADSADRATADLVIVTSERDAAQQATAPAVAKAADATEELAAANTEAVRVSGIATDAAAIADRLCDCDQRLSDAAKAIAVAASTNNMSAMNRAIDEFNAAVAEANAALDEYDAAIEELYGFGLDGSVMPV